jgi:hypothetical protein
MWAQNVVCTLIKLLQAHSLQVNKQYSYTGGEYPENAVRFNLYLTNTTNTPFIAQQIDNAVVFIRSA